MDKTKPNAVLVVDDERPILKLLERYLSRCGYDVDTAFNAEDGIRKIKDNSYALIVTDLKMRGTSGEQIYDYIRNDLMSQTPIIGMSGTPWLLDEAKFDAVLPKPFLEADLIKAIQKFI